MAKLVKILDDAGIDSTGIDAWIKESYRFIDWYLNVTNATSLIAFAEKYAKVDLVALEKACLKIETKFDVPFVLKDHE